MGDDRRRGGAVGEDHLVPVPEIAHALDEQLPEHGAAAGAAEPGGGEDGVVDRAEERVPLWHGGGPRRLAELSDEQRLPQHPGAVLNVGLDPALEEGLLVLLARAGLPAA